MSQQQSLSAMLKGQREVVQVEAKRGRGRPKNLPAPEDPALRELEREAVQRDLLTEVQDVHDPHPRWGWGSWIRVEDEGVGSAGGEIGVGAKDPWGSGEAVERGPSAEIEVVRVAG